MSLKLLSRHEGYLEIDHRASPGIPRHIALQLGLNPDEVGEGKRLEAATLSCKHCGGAWIKNPDRTRERGYCKVCDHYVCDDCKGAMSLPNYVHQTKEDIVEAVTRAVANHTSPDFDKPISIIVP